jgi:hypothetical protein
MRQWIALSPERLCRRLQISKSGEAQKENDTDVGMARIPFLVSVMLRGVVESRAARLFF